MPQQVTLESKEQASVDFQASWTPAIVVKTDKFHESPWMRNRIGLDDRVWEPFTPIRPTRGGFETLKHRFTVDKSGLPAQIEIKPDARELPLETRRSRWRQRAGTLMAIGRGRQFRAPMRLEAVVDGRLAEVNARWSPKPAVCVVMASEGYPGKYESGKVIEGLDRVATMDDVYVFHAGTERVEDLIVSSGGRVLGVTALGDDVAGAIDTAYKAVRCIEWPNVQFRTDIGKKALNR